MKAIVDRDRPDLERLVNGTGPSFPSGHVMAAAALWGLAPLVVTLYTRNRRIWWATTITSASLILAIGASRTYLGVHWLSDVVAGFIVGAFFLRGRRVAARPSAPAPSVRRRPPPSARLIYPPGTWLAEHRALLSFSTPPIPGRPVSFTLLRTLRRSA